MNPAQRICSISEKVAVASPYKHISYSGAPYNMDAITSATLTVEGPGVVTSTPISVRFLESAEDKNIHRGLYSDMRSGISTQRSYEGVTLQSILDGQIDKTVERLDDEVTVVFKNRWRQDIGRVAYKDIKSAAVPMIMAYGTANADGSNIRPFVFSMGAGEDVALGNGDGPLKLVYGQNGFNDLAAKNPKFSSVAYLYVEEGAPRPALSIPRLQMRLTAMPPIPSI